LYLTDIPQITYDFFMPIWKSPISLEILKQRCNDSLISHLCIEFVEVGDDFLTAKMAVAPIVVQPIGILHGGASAALAESVGSTAGNFCVDLEHELCVGLEININHVRPKTSGWLFATARPYHLGRRTHVWGIEIVDEKKNLIAISRHTVMILPREKHEALS